MKNIFGTGAKSNKKIEEEDEASLLLLMLHYQKTIKQSLKVQKANWCHVFYNSNFLKEMHISEFIVLYFLVCFDCFRVTHRSNNSQLVTKSKGARAKGTFFIWHHRRAQCYQIIIKMQSYRSVKLTLNLSITIWYRRRVIMSFSLVVAPLLWFRMSSNSQAKGSWKKEEPGTTPKNLLVKSSNKVIAIIISA